MTLTNGVKGRYNMVIGANGVGSAALVTTCPDAPTPTYASQLSLRWMAPGPQVKPEGWMAMVDAVVLGQCIIAASTLTEAYEAFMGRQFERTRTIVETSVELSRLEREHAPHSENVALIQKALGTLAQPY